MERQRFPGLLAAEAPLHRRSRRGVHVVALSQEGQILCAAVLRALPVPAETVRMRSRARPLFPVEQVHGEGLYDRLRILPDLPARRVRELGGFVKNHTCDPQAEAAIRAPLEVGVAIFRLLTGPLPWVMLSGFNTAQMVRSDLVRGRPARRRGPVHAPQRSTSFREV